MPDGVDNERHQNYSQKDDKNMQSNMDDLSLKLMEQIPTRHLPHLFVVSDYYVLEKERGQSLFCEMSVMVTHCVTDIIVSSQVIENKEGILTSPLISVFLIKKE